MLKQEKAFPKPLPHIPLHYVALPFIKTIMDTPAHMVAICVHILLAILVTQPNTMVSPFSYYQLSKGSLTMQSVCSDQNVSTRSQKIDASFTHPSHPSSTPSIATVWKKNTYISRFAESSGNIIYMVS